MNWIHGDEKREVEWQIVKTNLLILLFSCCTKITKNMFYAVFIVYNVSIIYLIPALLCKNVVKNMLKIFIQISANGVSEIL